jgi:hypothetical protein
MATTNEFDWQFIRGQQHFQKGGKKEELPTRIARAGYEAEKYQHENKIKKSEGN